MNILLARVLSPICLGGLSGLAQELISEFSDSLPGIDEAKGFMDILGLASTGYVHVHMYTGLYIN